MPLAASTTSIDRPVGKWDYDDLLAAVEEGDTVDWNLLAMEVEADPYGRLAQDLEEVLEATAHHARGRLFHRIIRSAVLNGAFQQRLGA